MIASCRMLEPLPHLKGEIDMVEFIWTWQAIKDFTNEARIIGKKLGMVAQPQPISTQPPGFFLTRFLRLPEILEAAVAASTGQDLGKHPDQAKKEAARVIQEWLTDNPEAGIEGLQDTLYKAFIQGADPSSISALDAEVERAKEEKKINQAQAAVDLEIKRAKLDASMETLEKMSSGKSPATLPT